MEIILAYENGVIHIRRVSSIGVDMPHSPTKMVTQQRQPLIQQVLGQLK